MSLIPLLWISKLRHLRLLFKIFMNSILIVLPKLDFVMPFFPATHQTMAVESAHWFEDEGDTIEGEDDDSDGNVDNTEEVEDEDEVDEEQEEEEDDEDDDIDDNMKELIEEIEEIDLD
jgi:hypothetical protein